MSRSSARWFIGNSTTSRRFSSPHSSITMRSTPGAMPPWGRRAVFEGAQHAAEAPLQLLLRIAGDRERPAHDLGLVVADRARGELDAVADDVD